MKPVERSSGLLRALRTVRERWLVVVACAAICVVGSLIVSLRAEKEYSASSKLLFRDPGFSSVLVGGNVFSPSIDPTRDATTDVLLTTSSAVATRVKQSLGLSDSVSDLTAKVTAAPEDNADIVDITATDPDPVKAARIANAFATEYVQYSKEANRQKIGLAIDDVRSQLNALPATATAERAQLQALLPKLVGLRALQFGNADVIGLASPPSSPTSPTPKQDALIALLLGLALGVALALALDYFDRRIKTVEDFEEIYGMRAIATVPERALEPRTEEDRRAALESYRMVRNGLSVLALDRDVRVLLVTSAVSGEGKTTLAVNLARTSALAGQDVVLVEADLRRPSFSRHLKLPGPREGLTNALVGKGSVGELLRDVPGTPGLRVLPCGPLPVSAGELLRTERVDPVLEELAAGADLVVVDAPPLVPVADAQTLLDSRVVDAGIVVGRAYLTKRDEARRAHAILDQHRLANLALVVAGAQDVADRYSYYSLPSSAVPDAPVDSNGARRGSRRRTRERA